MLNKRKKQVNAKAIAWPVLVYLSVRHLTVGVLLHSYINTSAPLALALSNLMALKEERAKRGSLNRKANTNAEGRV